MSETNLSKNEKLILSLYNIGAIKLGEFTLKSGATSPIYIDLRQIISYPDILRAVANLMWETISLCQFNLVCGIPYTALPIATCMSLQHNIPMIMRRKEAKKYGTKQKVEGVFKAGQTCLLVEDVITTGGSVLETADDLEAAGLIIYDVAIFIDREGLGKRNLMNRNYIVHAALTLTEILRGLSVSGLLNETEQALIKRLLLEHS